MLIFFIFIFINVNIFIFIFINVNIFIFIFIFYYRSYSNLLTNGIPISVPMESTSSVTATTFNNNVTNKRKSENTSISLPSSLSSSLSLPLDKKIKQETKPEPEPSSETKSVIESDNHNQKKSEMEPDQGLGVDSKFELKVEFQSQAIQSSEIDSQKEGTIEGVGEMTSLEQRGIQAILQKNYSEAYDIFIADLKENNYMLVTPFSKNIYWKLCKYGLMEEKENSILDEEGRIANSTIEILNSIEKEKFYPIFEDVGKAFQESGQKLDFTTTTPEGQLLPMEEKKNDINE